MMLVCVVVVQLLIRISVVVLVVVVIMWRYVRHVVVVVTLYLLSKTCNKFQRLTSFVSHEAHCTLVDNSPKNDKIFVFTLLLTDEMIRQITLQLLLLLRQITKINEKSGTHITFELFDLLVAGWAVISYEQVTVFE